MLTGTPGSFSSDSGWVSTTTAALAALEVTPIDWIIFWTGDAGLLLAIIKSVEDHLNPAPGIRIILYVKDSPFYLSTLLPVLYRELVIETQAVIDEGLNNEHRPLSMRARPKILPAGNYEEAQDIDETYKGHLYPAISGVAQSENYYPFGSLQSADGIVYIA